MSITQEPPVTTAEPEEDTDFSARVVEDEDDGGFVMEAERDADDLFVREGFR